MSDFKAKMHHWESLQRSPNSIAIFNGPTPKGRGKERRGEGKERKWKNREEGAVKSVKLGPRRQTGH